MAEDARAAILRVHQEHLDAVNSCNAELLLRGMADDVVYIGPGQEPIRGKAALREFIAPVYQQASISIEMEIDSLEIGESHAVEWGRVRGQMALGAGPPSPVRLQYMFVYRREQDGAWRVSHDIFNEAPSHAAQPNSA